MRVYFDHNATTPVRPEVFEAIRPFLTEKFGNPSSLHWAGEEVAIEVDKARKEVADLINAQPKEIVFTAGGSEADNMAIKGALAVKKEKGKHFITTAVEHPAVRNTAKWLQKNGYDVTFLQVDSRGRIDLDELDASFRDDTVLVSAMFANNETGTVFPVKEIGRIAKEHGVLFHCDAVQAAGKLPIDVSSLNVDMLSISGHKLNAPKGVGALFIRRGLKVEHLIHGGHQERGRRAGTENVVGIIGFGEAARLAKVEMKKDYDKLTALRNKLEKSILEKIPDVLVNGDKENRLPNTLNVSFRYVEGEGILLFLNEAGIAASSGSACTSGTLDPSHVLLAMGLAHEDAHGSVRFSLGYGNDEAQVDYVIEQIPPIIERLRKMSPLTAKARG
ncbi:MAG: cysteine desulfurase NifS [Deltaproteobacteria bacterium]|nr:cysteine desulfurase NifS [Deltaproteobacteria bacterium]